MRKHLDLAYYIESDVPANLVGDVTRLRQILVNLLSNALKFTEEGEVFVRVWQEEAERQETITSTHSQFSDTGIGIPADRMERLYSNRSPRSITPPPGAMAGTGLGLGHQPQIGRNDGWNHVGRKRSRQRAALSCSR